MPILADDIKLLKSAVMSDTTAGGGAMTGIEVVDGQSNNLFPDTSEMDRAFGRVQFRKLFGVAHTNDTDTLLGAHAVIVEPPEDPLVHCTLMETPGWADIRSVAKAIVEQYLVKGPKLAVRIYDTHYSGSLQLRLISFVNAPFPAGGDAIVLRNPDGSEQYVRLLKVVVADVTVAVTEDAIGTVVLSAKVATCDLGQALQMDVLGPPPARVFGANGVEPESDYAMVYSTTIAGGAKFYGIKPLAALAEVGDLSVVADGGIYTPVVPAATVESPIIDQAPTLGRAALAKTGYASTTLNAVTMTLAANTAVQAPSPIEPGTASFTHGATLFTDDGQGNLKQGATVVGTVDYAAGRATIQPGAPSYGSASLTFTYKPATAMTATGYSAAFTITIANQGLSFTSQFQPTPAPGSFSLSFMAQGRWYSLTDNMAGKLAGADSAYGIGTLNYTTGSMAVTLGALPDVGSPLIAEWGDGNSAKQVDPAHLPAKFAVEFALDLRTAADTATITWSRGATNYTATTTATGALTGDAAGRVAGGWLVFQPNVFPSGNITVNYDRAASTKTAHTNDGGGAYTLTDITGLVKGSFSAQVGITLSTPTAYPYAATTSLFDRDGTLYVRLLANGAELYGVSAVELAVGTINYATGAVAVSASAVASLWVQSINAAPGGTWQAGENIVTNVFADVTVTLANAALSSLIYAAGANTADSVVITPAAWTADVRVFGAGMSTHLVFRVGNQFYSAIGGAVRAGWNVSTGAPTVANAGAVATTGRVTLTSLPADGVNTITWLSAAQDASSREVAKGVFRTASAPLKSGVFQLSDGTNNASADDPGAITGGGYTGTVDYLRGVVRWERAAYVDPSLLRYNAVFLQYLPLDAELLGLETARLPLDGRAPAFRSGDLVLVHNTQIYDAPDPLTKGVNYNLGRVRIAAIKVRDDAGTVVPSTKYTADLDAGTWQVLAGADISMYNEPLHVENRIEDMVLCSIADISGKLSFTRSLTHDFPAGTSYASSVLSIGDVFARASDFIEQSTWTGVWSDSLIGTAPTANYNEPLYPPVVTNRGAITERWALIFTNTTTFRIVGESVGEIGTGTTGADLAPVNPATAVPYFTLSAAGWGLGWVAGNVYRFNTYACGAPFWVLRTVLQGPATVASDQFTLAWRGDVDAA